MVSLLLVVVVVLIVVLVVLLLPTTAITTTTTIPTGTGKSLLLTWLCHRYRYEYKSIHISCADIIHKVVGASEGVIQQYFHLAKQ